MKKYLSTVFILMLCTLMGTAQTKKQALTFNDILKWERITNTSISNNGNYVVYQLEPVKGDPTLKITTPKAEEIASVKCGSDAQITFDSKYVVFTLKPAEDTVRQLKLKKTKKEDLPKNKLVVFDLKTKKQDTVDNLVSVKVPEKWSGWIAWQAEAPKDTTSKEKGNGKKEPKGKDDSDEKPNPFFIRNLNTGSIIEFPAVTGYQLAEENESLVFISEGKDSTFEAGVYFLDLKLDNPQKIAEKGKYKQLSIDKAGKQVVFLKDNSDKKKKEEPNFALYYWAGSDMSTEIANNSNSSIPENWEISENGKLTFSDNGRRIFFGTAPVKTPKDTTKLEEEIPMLDVWTWNEEQLQTVQLVNRNRDLKKTYLAVYHTDEEKLTQLETKEFTGIRQVKKGDADKVIAWSNHPYAVQSMWEGGPEHNDIYLVDIITGEATMIKKDLRATPQVSPEGKYLYWYNAVDTSWNTYHIETGKEYKISSPQTIQIADELNDVPNLPDSYRNGGWTKNDESFLIYDRYDIWIVDPENRNAPENITQNGKQNKITYRIIKFDEERRPGRFGGGNADEKGVDIKKPLLLDGHNEKTRADGFYELSVGKSKTPKALLTGNFKLNKPEKAKEADVVIFSKEDFETYPDLLATDLSFKKTAQISNGGQQQKDFNWGTAELVSWTSLDGLQLQGTLHKPADFDPSKKYPMIVNFYEKSSQELLSYHMPDIGRSTIDYHWYTSNGYLVFNPDVYYKEGYPGEDAFNCVMPGVTMLIEKGFVDEKHIGAQGHSWGGYQVAYLATKTNLFAAIESGAPVVNMFSAYGGIRWTSGLNRSFQYEHTQSRIGKSIWEAPLRYLENSPLFTIDKITTPLLIMANDDDGAVPWYQGIEFFIGLRRLQKPAWLLNYNEADHWPTKLRDREDFQIRLSQFFGHYLKGEPMPKWMKEGIPAVEKGIELRY